MNIECTDSTDAEALLKILLNSIAKVGLTIDKRVGQCYDGASNMSGAIAGVQAKVKALQPRAIYILTAMLTVLISLSKLHPATNIQEISYVCCRTSIHF